MATHAAGSADPIAVFGGPSLSAEQYKCVILKLRDRLPPSLTVQAPVQYYLQCHTDEKTIIALCHNVLCTK